MFRWNRSERLAALTSTNTARTYGLYPKKGAIMTGSDADFIIVDSPKEWQVEPERLFYKNKWTPYAGKLMRGQIVSTIVRGRTVYENGEVRAEPGYGIFQRRKDGDA